MSKFQVGDEVRAFGVDGVVRGIDAIDRVLVKLGGRSEYFYEDGRFAEWHTEPSLVLVERAKPKWFRGDVSTHDGIILAIDSRPVKALIDIVSGFLEHNWDFNGLGLEYCKNINERLDELEALLKEES